ncbi:molybdopterin dinucleotide-binding region [Oleiphilus messinensis]|uniref:Molybdopterin dinucleotide-binding region n=1 Tax=Oleiphilus messinensis TaxID=141451 RepID=A0A1Y0IEM7_9GAMM|nr:molybdopterin oxidoreductase family protein [Oleiphilus messinensis]ARU58987.1 molybdopterin dinucleotide-binding region [Oleiphilus messinensis]
MNKPLTHYRTCNLCEAMCGLEITHTKTEIISIKGDKNDRFSRGHICPKAVALQDLHEDPERLRKPLERTDTGWREISWDEALDKAAAGLSKIQKQYGNNAVASYLGNPNVHNTGAMLMGRHLHNALRTRNKFSATSVDQLPHHIVAWHLFGHQLKIAVPDIDHCTHMLILGGNPVASNGSIMTVPDVKNRLKSIQKQGGKVVVIDPRKTETAEIATEHHFIRPGTDALLLLAMIHILYRDNRVSPGRLESVIDGLDDIAAAVAPYAPDTVAPVVGIPASEIERMVSEFCAADQAVCYGRMGVSVQEFGLLSQYLVMLFNILTGRLDERGGLMFAKPAADILSQTGRGHMAKSHTRVRGLPEFGGEFPVSALAEEMLTPGEGQIKGLVSVAGNPVLSTPNGEQLSQALEGLDFMVAIDFYINETTRHANIVLPPVSPLEREHYDVIFHSLAVRNTARYAPALFEAAPESKHDWEIYLGLEARMRPATRFKDKLARRALSFTGPKALLEILLRTGPYGGGIHPTKGLSIRKLKANPHGIDFGPLQPVLPKSLYHRDKRIKLNPDFYFADLERIQKRFFASDSDTEFLLIGRRHVRSNNSWLHNSQRLVKGKSRCTAQINPEDAQKLAIENDQLLRLHSRAGTIEIEAEITDRIMPGVISVPHGWGHNKGDIRQTIAMAHAGVSVNDLTDEKAVDLLSGNAVLNGVPISVEVVSQA